MRVAFVHNAMVHMAPDADMRAPGAAITVALCGHWEHDPPCPLAAHHSHAERFGAEVRLRILFATEPEREAEVRHRIDAGLRSGRLAGPDGRMTSWQLCSSQPGTLTPADADHADELIRH